MGQSVTMCWEGSVTLRNYTKTTWFCNGKGELIASQKASTAVFSIWDGGSVFLGLRTVNILRFVIAKQVLTIALNPRDTFALEVGDRPKRCETV